MRIFRNSLAAALLAVGLAAAPALAQMVAFEGVAALFNTDRATVVYPSGDESGRSSRRRSAERLAAFLDKKHGVICDVVSDTEIGDEQRAGHLVLLGWDNRLLGTAAAPRPFRRNSTGMTVIDTIHAGPDDDLLLIHRSPYNPRKFLVFWSRIDPELDRFNVLPFLGSDLGVFRDYKPIHLGRFAPDPSWPPRLEEYGLISRPWDPPPFQEESAHYRLHHDPGALDAEAAGQILAAREQALASAVEALGDPGADFKITLYVFSSDKEKWDRTGVPDKVHSIPRKRELFMSLVPARGSDPHEEIHLIARELLGPGYSTALYEGLSVALSRDAGSELPVIAGLMIARKRLPTIADLLDEEALRVLSDGGLGFPASGLLVSWLREIDLAGFSRIYSTEGPTAPELAALLDLDVGEMESAYRDWVSARAEAASTDLEFRRLLADGTAKREAGDEQGFIQALTRALKLKPGEPRTLYRLALAQLRQDQEKKAERRFLELLKLPLETDELDYRIFALYRLGRLYDDQGRRDRALARYREVLELPDRQGSHRKANEAIESPPG